MRKATSRFYCFSPPAMIATFMIELVLAGYTFIRYGNTAVTRLATAILVLLALFQLSEFNVCGKGLDYPLFWSRLGFVSITLLPAVGLHLIHKIKKIKINLLVLLSYAMSLSFALIFGFSTTAFASHACTGNYAVFHLSGHLGGYYFVYYYVWLFIGIATSLYYALEASARVRTALIMMAGGYLSFLLPSAIINTINPATAAGIPSVMCGFAVIYALILAFGVVPTTSKKSKH